MQLIIALAAFALSVVLFVSSRRFRPCLSIRKGEAVLSAFQYLSLLSSLCLVLGTGAEIQRYLLAAISSEEANIYATINHEAIARVYPLASWLIFSIQWSTAIPAAVTLAASLFARNYRELALYAALGAFLSLFACDTLIGFLWARPTTYFLENFFTDVLGGVVISCILIMLFRLVDLILLYTSNARTPVSIVALATPILIGLALNLAAYFMVNLLYNPTSSRIAFALKPPINGIYWPKREPNPKGEGKPFGVFSTPGRLQNDFAFRYIDAPLNAEWSHANSEASARVVVYVNCLPEGAAALAKRGVGVRLGKASQVSVRIDRGTGTFTGNLLKNDPSFVYLSPADELTQFWLTANSKVKSTTLSRFVRKKADAHYWSADGKLSFATDIYLYRREKDRSVIRAAHTMWLRFGERTAELKFIPVRVPESVKTFPCSAVDVPELLTGGQREINVHGVIAGVAITLEAMRRSDEYSDVEKDAIRVTSSGDFSTTVTLDQKLSPLITAGYVKAMVIDEGLTHLSVNDVDTQLSTQNRLFIGAGDVLVVPEDDGSLVAEGTADAAFRDRIRLSPTRWERLGFPLQTVAFTVLGTILLSLLAACRAILVRNDVVYWTSL